jgi:hypothetical protein
MTPSEPVIPLYRLRRRRFGALFALLAWVSLSSCSERYRVGEHVLVEWETGTGHLYPAYVLERVGESRFRVHFDGYDSRFDEEVGIDRIKGRVEGPVATPPPPTKVARTVSSSQAPDAGAALAVNPYKEGDRVRVSWRNSVYPAIVLEVTARDRVRVHYEGLESAWDETVTLDRLVGRR